MIFFLKRGLCLLVEDLGEFYLGAAAVWIESAGDSILQRRAPDELKCVGDELLWFCLYVCWRYCMLGVRYKHRHLRAHVLL